MPTLEKLDEIISKLSKKGEILQNELKGLKKEAKDNYNLWQLAIKYQPTYTKEAKKTYLLSLEKIKAKEIEIEKFAQKLNKAIADWIKELKKQN